MSPRPLKISLLTSKIFFTSISLGILLVLTIILSGCDRAIIYPGELTQTARAITPPATSIASPTSAPKNPLPTKGITAPSKIISPTQAPTPEPTTTWTPTPQFTLTAFPTIDSTKNPPILYYSQSGDTLDALAIRFNVAPEEITSPGPIPAPEFLIQPNQLLIIPNRNFLTGPGDRAMPDSEIIYSPSAKDFNTADYVKKAGGYLSTYKEYLPEGWYNGAQIIDRLSLENSISPRIFLAILEHQSHWVFGKPTNMAEVDYPMGYIVLKDRGLYYQLGWAARMLSTGYYGWRTGQLLDYTYKDEKTKERLAPQLNAGTVALQYLYGKIDGSLQELNRDLYSPDGLPELYQKMFGDPWARSQSIEPLFPPHLTQPTLEMPFLPGHIWSLTGGPHYAWFPDAGSLAALDFAPPADEPGCIPSQELATSVGPGIVTRAELGIVAVDMDMDGKEQTGWTIFYLHIDTDSKDTAKVGTILKTGDPIGHPSCKGGEATGTHLHIARKYNGEWMAADGPVPFVLSGYRAVNGAKPYQGGLMKDGILATADPETGDRAIVTRPLITDTAKTATPSPTPKPN